MTATAVAAVAGAFRPRPFLGNYCCASSVFVVAVAVAVFAGNVGATSAGGDGGGGAGGKKTAAVCSRPTWPAGDN